MQIQIKKKKKMSDDVEVVQDVLGDFYDKIVFIAF